jgi:hypothetical protein
MILAYPIDIKGNKAGEPREFDEAMWKRLMSMKNPRWVELKEPKIKENQYDMMFQAAKTAENNEDFEAALSLYEKAYELKPNNYIKGKINKLNEGK